MNEKLKKDARNIQMGPTGRCRSSQGTEQSSSGLFPVDTREKERDLLWLLCIQFTFNRHPGKPQGLLKATPVN